MLPGRRFRVPFDQIRARAKRWAVLEPSVYRPSNLCHPEHPKKGARARVSIFADESTADTAPLMAPARSR